VITGIDKARNAGFYLGGQDGYRGWSLADDIF
jgi:hypothetical protein